MMMLVLSLFACSSSTATPVGLLGQAEIALPDGIERPAELESHVGRLEVCGSIEFGPAEVELRWSTFRLGDDFHVVRVEAELVRDAPNLEVVADIDPQPASSALEQGAWKGIANVDFRCHRVAFKGLTQHDEQLIEMCRVTGDGHAMVVPSL